MYSVTVRSHVMIAHSFQGEVFGPAQALHGATYVVDAEFRRAGLDRNGLVIDIGFATRLLEDTLAPINYCNLDNFPEFKGKNTTTEFLAAYLHGALCAGLVSGLPDGDSGPESLRVTLNESHVASATFDGPVAVRV